MKLNRAFLWAASISAMILFACSKEKEQASATDPLPLPEEMEKAKDVSVDPGDDFYQYCNGTWLKNTPVPASGATGGLYAQEPAMQKRVEELKSSVPDISRFYALMEDGGGQPEQSRAFLEALKARYEKPTTREDALLTMGRMMADGISLWPNPIVPTWAMVWKDGRLMGTITPPISEIIEIPENWNPANFVPISETRSASDDSALNLIIRGMGLDPGLFVFDAAWTVFWEQVDTFTLEKLCKLIDEAWAYYEMFATEQLTDSARNEARASLNYTLSYHFAQRFISPEFKEKYVGITREIQASLRKRIEKVEWMSETTRKNALDKLDAYSLYVACPDEWHTDCVASYSDCGTLLEAVYRNNHGTARLKGYLLGGKDAFSYQITTNLLAGTGISPSDLTLVNAMYSPTNNAVFIYPAVLLPPFLPENVSDAYSYAAFVSIGHEFTHGFDNNGSQYDKWGNKRNWWTVADKMAFEERRDKIVDCYSHLDMDPQRIPGVYGDGDRTQGENIADLGGFLTALDAYRTHLESEGYLGETLKLQLKKFYESYANCWRLQYSDAKLESIRKDDVHSHARLRINGVVMNTDLWYELYDVDRNNILYLPEERRTYIW